MPSQRDASPELQAAMDECREKVNKTLARLLPDTDLPEERIYDAMRYGTMNGGKRLRPFMVVQSAMLFTL